MTQSWWEDLDADVLSALETAGGRLTPAEIASRVGMSEDAVRSVVAMLAERGQVRIAAVELTPSRGLARAPARTVPFSRTTDHRQGPPRHVA